MVMMGLPFENWFLEATDAASMSDAPAGPIVTVDLKKIRRDGRVAAFPGFYLRKLDTISPAKSALVPRRMLEGLGQACVAANLSAISGRLSD